MALTKVIGAGAEGLTLSSTSLTVANGLTLTDGNVTLASGHGIDFSATANASAGSPTMASELFDDYEEGTFTPGLIDSADGLGANLTTAVGQYTKVGNKVHFQMRINGDARTSTGNQVYITNLPFTCSPVSYTHLTLPTNREV